MGPRTERPHDEAAIRALRALRTHLPELLHPPGSPRYDHARRVYFTGVDRRPSVVIAPHTPDEVAQAVRIVSAEGGRLTLKGGGHGFACRGVADGVPMLDLSALDAVSVDPEARLARAGGGTTTGAFTRAAGAHGLAVGFGDSPKVGIAGITQAGGLGFLHRRLGLTVDQLAGAQVVTAQGAILEVSAAHEPELFWALRGGGGGFGVVTRLDFRLAPVATVVGGMLMAPTDAATFHEALEALHAAPPEVSGILQALRAPPIPMIPAELHGALLLAAFVVHSGDPARGERWMADFRKLIRPVQDTTGPLAYPALFDDHGGPADPPRLRWRSVFRDPLSATEVAALFELLEEPHDGIMRTVQLRPLGGAVSRVPGDATAFAHREAPVLASAGAVFAGEADAGPHRAWVRSVQERLAGGDPRGAYAGFLGEEDLEGPKAAWPEPHRARLRQVKERFDPGRVFEAAFEAGSEP
jgi:FAD/FMN-containing dehydrogenase